ncbi:ATP-binding protein [Desulfococcaceae bacterium HSG9]|nr:ATP-binding protein [Desulfococcaceae bacterium HSG9]
MTKPVIICVDDELFVLAGLEKQLKYQFGKQYKIETTSSGNEALEIFKHYQKSQIEIPLMIADQVMPGMQGDELLIEIHTMAPDTLTILLTGLASAEAVGNAVNFANLYRFIAKPWYREDLLLTVKEALTHYFQKKTIKSQELELRRMNELLEEKVRKRTAEVLRQKTELQDTLENLKQTQSKPLESEKMASLGLLTAGIAHEINNPVNYIYAGIDSLKEDLRDVFEVIKGYEQITAQNVNEALENIRSLKEEVAFDELITEVHELTSSIKRGAERTAEIVKGLRTFSHLDKDILETADIYENLETTLIMLRSQYKNRIQIVKSYADLPLIECYPHKLNQVFMNILVNAIQAITDKGVIHITTSLLSDKTPQTVSIEIRDTGHGISDKIRSKIFDPFFTTKDVGQGTGLGLSISFSIIEKHRGSIAVTTRQGEGTAFTIYLPLHTKELKNAKH